MHIKKITRHQHSFHQEYRPFDECIHKWDGKETRGDSLLLKLAQSWERSIWIIGNRDTNYTWKNNHSKYYNMHFYF